MAKGVTRWQALDGRYFDSKEEAEAHEFACDTFEKMHSPEAKDPYKVLLWVYKNLHSLGLTWLPSAKDN